VMFESATSYFSSVYFFSVFASAFKPNAAHEGRYANDADKNDAGLKARVDALLQDSGTFIVKLAGKNNVLPQHRQILAGIVDAMVIMLYFLIVTPVGAKRIVLVSEGDNLEMALDDPADKYTPFSHAQLKFIQFCTKHGVEIHFLIVKNSPPENGFSAPFVDGWMEALEGSIEASNVYFGLVATGNDELTFKMAHLVPFIGTTMCEDYMYKKDGNGAKVPTTGFKHVMQLDLDPEFTRLPGSTGEPQETFIMFVNTALQKRFKNVNPASWNVLPWTS
jgi:hypothetical protein